MTDSVDGPAVDRDLLDVAVEELIRAELGHRVPDDEIYGEEGGTTVGISGRRWVIDPIDGTSSFTRRIPLFNTRLAYEDEHGPAIGVINQPAAQQIVFAARGLGCWQLTGTHGDVTAARRTRVGDRDQLAGSSWTPEAGPSSWSPVRWTPTSSQGCRWDTKTWPASRHH